MNQEKIGKLIAKKRKEKRLTQAELASMLEVTNKSVSKWENGRCMPDISIIEELCKILSISVTTLLNGEESNDEKLVIKLLWLIGKLKQLRYAIVGLLICNLALQLENLKIFDWLEDGTFIKGFLDGSFVGIKLVGVFVFFYGFVSYCTKNQKYFRI